MMFHDSTNTAPDLPSHELRPSPILDTHDVTNYQHDSFHTASSAPNESEQLPPPLPPPFAPNASFANHPNKVQTSQPFYQKTTPRNTRIQKGRMIACFVLLVAIIVIVVVVVPVSLVRKGDNRSDSTSAPPTSSPPVPRASPLSMSTLDAIRERGFLQCGVTDQIGFSVLVEGKREGFEVDLCRAVGAAIFGNDSQVELIVLSNDERFDVLQSGQVDVLAAVTTYTMQRDVFDPSLNSSLSFSTPYLYSGLGFAGQPHFVTCAEGLKTKGNCNGVQICVLDGTTHVAIVERLFPGFNGIVLATSIQNFYLNFVQGQCNVLAGEQFDLSELVVKQKGYIGNYTVGLNQFSKEPLALVTRDDDVTWSVFVDWVVLALLTAEDQKVTQSLAASIVQNPTSPVDESQLMFVHAVAAVGNYGEMYQRHLEPIVPRAAVNTINNGSSPLIYSFPFGNISIVGPGPKAGGTLEKVATRGFLRCGISANTFFASYNYTSQEWTGLDSDFCRAVSAALFKGISDNVIFVPISAAERFEKLQSGDIDLLSRQTSATYERETIEPTTKQGFSFSRPVFYTGVQFGGIPPYGECAERLDVTSSSCKNLLICVNNGTTTIARVRELIPERFIIAESTEQKVAECLTNGKANVIAGDGFFTANATIRKYYSGSYEEGTKLFSKESLALVTRQDDPQWSSFVNWIVTASFYAEEQGISQSTFQRMPLVNLFGATYATMFQDAIRAVGSYSDIYKRSAESKYPRTILNKLNTAPFGPEQYPLPGLQF